MSSYFVDIGIFVVGLFVSFFGNYFIVTRDLSYIKGQLTQLLKMTDHVDDLITKYAMLEKDITVTNERLNYLERQLRLNGGYHGTSS